MSVHLAERGIRLVLLDIEGTTTPIAFVHDVLFPYARRRLRGWLDAQMGSSEWTELAAMLRDERAADLARGEALPPWDESSSAALGASLHRYLDWLMDRDRKSPALKRLQGWIWDVGYRAGELHGRIYDDVAPAMRRWRDAGVEIAIYSSGSELTQRRLFASTPAGDLTPLITAHFDTAVGPKISADSYRRIVESLGKTGPQVLFVSDVVAELSAARAAGCDVVLCLRSGHPPVDPGQPFDRISSLAEVV